MFVCCCSCLSCCSLMAYETRFGKWVMHGSSELYFASRYNNLGFAAPDSAIHMAQPACRNLTRKDLLKQHMERHAEMYAGHPKLSQLFTCMPTTFALPQEHAAFEAAFRRAGLHSSSGDSLSTVQVWLHEMLLWPEQYCTHDDALYVQRWRRLLNASSSTSGALLFTEMTRARCIQHSTPKRSLWWSCSQHNREAATSGL